MELCNRDTLRETWGCLKEENGELLPLILFAECLWWIFMLFIFNGVVQMIRRWREKRRLEKEMRQKWEDKWIFPPQRNN